ncbi:MAG: O-antigen ligase family protein [Candidatus Omnitrophica bacterium]|nr:O-antigen ligase family protein [Candidatus Omnitrophota bacterium]
MNKLISILLAFIIFFAPFAIGTVAAWSEFVLRISILAIFFLFVIKSVKGGVLEYKTGALNVFFTVFILYMAFQVLFKTSILPRYTTNALEITVIYFMLYFVVAGMVKKEEDVHNIISRITITGFLVSALGIVQFLTKTDKIYWIRPVRSGSFFGPFVNENHFACYISMAALVTLGGIVSSVRKWKRIPPDMPFKYMVLNVFENILNEKTLFKILAFAVMAASLFLSKSRSGMVFFLASMAFFILFAASGKNTKKIVWIALLGILASILLLDRIGVDTAVSRLGSVFKSGEYEGRLTLYMQGLKILTDYPLFGTGIGTFANIFPIYQFGSELLYYMHLHNDILQLLIEAGVIGFIIISMPFLAFIMKFISRLAGASDTYKYCVGLSILASLFYLSLHSLTDFSMRLNAISSLFVILTAVSTPLLDPGGKRELHIKGKIAKPLLYTALTVVFISFLFLASRPFIITLLCEKGQSDLSFRLAMRLDPKNDAVYFDYCGFILDKLGRKEIKEQDAYETAIKALDKAIQLNPYKTKYLTAKGEICSRRHDYGRAFDLLRKAALMEPDNSKINLIYSYMIFWKAVNEIDASERERLLTLGLAYYKRATALSKHIHLYMIINDKGDYQLLKSILKDIGIDIE